MVSLRDQISCFETKPRLTICCDAAVPIPVGVFLFGLAPRNAADGLPANVNLDVGTLLMQLLDSRIIQ